MRWLDRAVHSALFNFLNLNSWKNRWVNVAVYLLIVDINAAIVEILYCWNNVNGSVSVKNMHYVWIQIGLRTKLTSNIWGNVFIVSIGNTAVGTIWSSAENNVVVICSCICWSLCDWRNYVIFNIAVINFAVVHYNFDVGVFVFLWKKCKFLICVENF